MMRFIQPNLMMKNANKTDNKMNDGYKRTKKASIVLRLNFRILNKALNHAGHLLVQIHFLYIRQKAMMDRICYMC